MKKTKLIAPLFTLAALPATVLPIVACSQSETVHIVLDKACKKNFKMTIDGKEINEINANEDVTVKLTSVDDKVIQDQLTRVWIGKNELPQTWFKTKDHAEDATSIEITISKEDVFDDVVIYANCGKQPVSETLAGDEGELEYKYPTNYPAAGEPTTHRLAEYIEAAATTGTTAEKMLVSDLLHHFAGHIKGSSKENIAVLSHHYSIKAEVQDFSIAKKVDPENIVTDRWIYEATFSVYIERDGKKWLEIAGDHVTVRYSSGGLEFVFLPRPGMEANEDWSLYIKLYNRDETRAEWEYTKDTTVEDAKKMEDVWNNNGKELHPLSQNSILLIDALRFFNHKK